MRVPSTKRAWPVWALSQLFKRWAGVMPLCMDTMAASPRLANRCRTRSSSWGVRLISGTSISTWASGSCANTKAARRRYTSVLPLPVLPCSTNGPGSLSKRASAVACSVVSRGGVLA